MPAHKDTAIVLRRLDYSETSQVLAVFSRDHGQQRLIAKGIKRGTKTRVAVGIDLLEAGEVVFSRRPGHEDVLGILTEWRQTDTFPHLRRDLARLYAAQYAADVTAALTEVHDPHAALFDALLGLLRGLRNQSPLPALCEFLWSLLGEIGLRPELSRCMSCNPPVCDDKWLYFSSREGGSICRDCEPATVEKRRIAPAAAAWLLHLTNGVASPLADDSSTAPEPDPDAASTVPAVFDLLDHHLTQTLGHPPKLTTALRQTLTLRAPRR